MPRLLIALLLTVSLVGMVGVNEVFAQSTSLTDKQLQQIKDNCLSAKNTLNQLHASDALLRVNRGQLYEAINTKLMNNFNTRVTSNGEDAQGLILVTTSYKTMLETFRRDYQSYEQQLSAAIKVDCATKPAEFYNTVEAARSLRTTVHTDIVRLNQYIDDYRAAVNDFLINFKRTNQ